MPTRSPGDVSATTIAELGLPGRAVAALTRAGIVRVEDLAALSRRDLAAISGLGPGMIAAIRLIVPEPPPAPGRPGTSPGAVRRQEAGPADEESPDAPTMPSFDSLRAPRRRTAIDVLLPDPPHQPAASRPAPAGAPRPAEYGDLLRLAARLARAAAVTPGRVAWWSVQQPVRCLRRLLGDQVGTGPAAGGRSR